MNIFELDKKMEDSFDASDEELRAMGVNPARVIQAFFGGSRVICNPPPKDTDCDVVLLVESLWAFENKQSRDWESPLSEYGRDNSTFITLRRGEYNLMVFSDPTEFGAVKGATALAKHLNITDKAKRYELFEKIRSPWR